MDEPDRRTYIKRFRRPNLENMQRQTLCKAVNTMARKVVYCPYCSATNGAVKKAGALKIIHDKYRAKKTADEMERWKKTFAPAVEAQKELGVYLNKAVHEDLNPLKVLDLFRRVSDEVPKTSSLYWLCVNFETRIVNYSACTLPLVDQKNSYGNIYPFRPSVFVHRSLRTGPPQKMTSPSS